MNSIKRIFLMFVMSAVTVLVPLQAFAYYGGTSATKSNNISISEYGVTYNISYALDGGTLPSDTKYSYRSKVEQYTLPTPTKQQHKFIGWTGSNGSTPQLNVTISKADTGNKNYTANWEKVRAVFVGGRSLNSKMKALAGSSKTDIYDTDEKIVSIKYSSNKPDISTMSEKNIVSSSTSPIPIYMWFESGTIYWWSEDPNPQLGSDLYHAFSYLTNLSNITGVRNWDTSNVTNFSYMFNYCSSLNDLAPIKNWDTSKATNFSSLFYKCTSLNNLTPISNWTTGNVTNFSYLFYNCSSLNDLTPINNWKTGNVTNFSYLFYNCTGLTSINLSNWDTRKATNFSYLCSGCTSLNNITPINNWDTSQVTDLRGAFDTCSSLVKADLGNWNTSKVTSFDTLFSNCTNLSDVTPLGNWNTSSVTNLGSLFYQCSSLTDLTALGSWDTSNVTNLRNTFAYCRKLTKIDLSNWDISQVSRVNKQNMFSSAAYSSRSCTVVCTEKTENSLTDGSTSITGDYFKFVRPGSGVSLLLDANGGTFSDGSETLQVQGVSD